MKFFDFIFYRYYAYLYSKHTFGDDLLKAQFMLSMFQFFNLLTIIVYVKNIFEYSFFEIFHFLIMMLLIFLCNKYYYNSKKVELLIEKNKKESEDEIKVGNFVLIVY